MKFVKLEPITAKAAQVIRQYGDIWKVHQKIEKPDLYYFQSRKPHLYISPMPQTTRNPRENLGENYVPPSTIPSAGSRWILENNDPDFECTEHKFGRA